jgi:hypothetical protein
MQVNIVLIDKESGLFQGISSDPAMSEIVYTP